jgi:glycosyltransferase involved in cell wall biosynthesis
MVIKLLYVVSHPIQYQAPLLRKIAEQPDVDLRVLFERIHPDNRYFDTGFGREVKWDINLTDGYEHAAMADADLKQEISCADVIWLHGWQTPRIRSCLRQAKRSGRPVLMRGENCDLAMPDGKGIRGWLKKRFVSEIFKRCDLYLAIGSENRRYYLNRGISPDQIIDMPYAIDNASFGEWAEVSRPHQSALRDRLGISPTRRVVLFAGKLQPRKNPELLVRSVAMANWAAEAPALIFVGDGELRAGLQELAPEAIFMGFVNQTEMPAYYDLADVFVLPSFREPWGLAVNEAMACGTATIVSDQVGCAADLVDRTNGRIVKAGDTAALSKALVECLENSDEMGKASHRKIAGWGYDQDVAGLKTAIAKAVTLK